DEWHPQVQLHPASLGAKDRKVCGLRGRTDPPTPDTRRRVCVTSCQTKEVKYGVDLEALPERRDSGRLNRASLWRYCAAPRPADARAGRIGGGAPPRFAHAR